MVDRAIRYLKERRSGLSETEIAQVAATIVREANIHGIDPNLVMAVIHIESRGKHLREKRQCQSRLMSHHTIHYDKGGDKRICIRFRDSSSN